MSLELKNLILICPDYGVEIGLGHWMRCESIAKELAAIGWDCLFILETAPPKNVPHYILRSNEIGQAAEVLRVAKETGASALLIDSYQLEKNFYSQIRSLRASLPVIVIDDYGEKSNYPFHALIQPGLKIPQASYSSYVLKNSLRGAEALILRPEIRELKPKAFSEEIKTLAISMGGSDPEMLGPQVAELLSEIDAQVEIHLILGPLFNAESFSLANLQKKKQIHIHYNPSNYPFLIQQADAGICGAGATSLEFCYLGVPSLAIAVAENQRSQAQALKEFDLSLTLHEISDLSLRKSLRLLLDSPSLRRNFHYRGSQLIDGLGSQRVAKFIANYLKNYHSDIYSTSELESEYNQSSKAPHEFEKVKWGSEEGMLSRFQIVCDQIDWNAAHRWLDIGSGTGGLLRAAGDRARNIDYRGIDLSEELIKFADSKKYIVKSKEFIHHNFLENLESEKFDLVTSLGVLQKCGTSLPKAVARFSEFLDRNGRLIVTTKNKDWIAFKNQNLVPEKTHHWFTLEELREAFVQAGLEILKLEGFSTQENRLCPPEESHNVLIVAEKTV